MRAILLLLAILAAPLATADILPSAFRVLAVDTIDGRSDSVWEGLAHAVDGPDGWEVSFFVSRDGGADWRWWRFPADVTIEVQDTPLGPVTREEWVGENVGFVGAWGGGARIDEPEGGPPLLLADPAATGKGVIAGFQVFVRGHT